MDLGSFINYAHPLIYMAFLSNPNQYHQRLVFLPTQDLAQDATEVRVPTLSFATVSDGASP